MALLKLKIHMKAISLLHTLFRLYVKQTFLSVKTKSSSLEILFQSLSEVRNILSHSRIIEIVFALFKSSDTLSSKSLAGI